MEAKVQQKVQAGMESLRQAMLQELREETRRELARRPGLPMMATVEELDQSTAIMSPEPSRRVSAERRTVTMAATPITEAEVVRAEGSQTREYSTETNTNSCEYY